MNKFLQMLLVRRPEAKNKWWHRLALVIIYGSTILLAVFLATVLISEEGDRWASYSYTAYSFEKEYPTAKGSEVDCKFSATSLGNLPPVSIFHCGDLSSDSEFLDKYSRARGTYEELQQMRKEINANYATQGLSGLLNRANATDDQIMTRLIQGDELDNVKVKRTLSVNFASLLENWGLFTLLVLGWVIVWESIVYRTLLFIAYGKKND